MTWIVLGDSWSAISLNNLLADEFYEFEDCIFNRLRNQFPKEIVHPWAECGIGALEQLDRLRDATKGQPLDDVKIPVSYTHLTLPTKRIV